MASYYQGKRDRNIFDPSSKEPFKLSRTKIENFVKCPRCSYIDLRLGVGQPPGYPFNLNSAVDTLLKKEFDIHRAQETAHPLMESYGIDALPFQHADLNRWRNTRQGIAYLHKPTNLLIYGGVDDVWVNPQGELIVVDYKATSKNSEVSLDADWQKSYKRQMDIYQWLFRQNGFKVSNISYFVYCNGRRDAEAFDSKLEFDVVVLPYQGDDSWIEKKLEEIKKCLISDKIPDPNPDCEFCKYRYAVEGVVNKSQPKEVL